MEKYKFFIDTVEQICKPFKIGHSQVCLEGQTIYCTIEPGLSRIKYNKAFGYYITLSKHIDGTYKELFSLTEKDKNKFIEQAIVGIGKAFPEYAKLAHSRVKSADMHFIVGHTYMGRCEKTLNTMSIIITKRTPQYVYYETDTGITGRTIVKIMGKNEAIMIDKADKLYVNSCDIWS